MLEGLIPPMLTGHLGAHGRTYRAVWKFQAVSRVGEKKLGMSRASWSITSNVESYNYGNLSSQVPILKMERERAAKINSLMLDYSK